MFKRQNSPYLAHNAAFLEQYGYLKVRMSVPRSGNA